MNSTACGTNGNCATYDAFGRMVEFSKNSTYKENWYTQGGTVVMSGTTLAEAYLVAPGGGTFMELGGQNDFLHKDWLGNARIASLISAQTASLRERTRAAGSHPIRLERGGISMPTPQTR